MEKDRDNTTEEASDEAEDDEATVVAPIGPHKVRETFFGFVFHPQPHLSPLFDFGEG